MTLGRWADCCQRNCANECASRWKTKGFACSPCLARWRTFTDWYNERAYLATCQVCRTCQMVVYIGLGKTRRLSTEKGIQSSALRDDIDGRANLFNGYGSQTQAVGASMPVKVVRKDDLAPIRHKPETGTESAWNVSNAIQKRPENVRLASAFSPRNVRVETALNSGFFRFSKNWFDTVKMIGDNIDMQ